MHRWAGWRKNPYPLDDDRRINQQSQSRTGLTDSAECEQLMSHGALTALS
jgi:hypothetical protein